MSLHRLTLDAAATAAAPYTLDAAHRSTPACVPTRRLNCVDARIWHQATCTGPKDTTLRPTALLLPANAAWTAHDARAFWQTRLCLHAPMFTDPSLSAPIIALLVLLTPEQGTTLLVGLHEAAVACGTKAVSAPMDFQPEMLTWLLTGMLHKKAASQYDADDAQRIFNLVQTGRHYVSFYPRASARFAQYNALAQFSTADAPEAVATATALRQHTAVGFEESSSTILDCVYEYKFMAYGPGCVARASLFLQAPLTSLRKLESFVAICQAAQKHLQDADGEVGSEPGLPALHAALQTAAWLLENQLHRPLMDLEQALCN